MANLAFFDQIGKSCFKATFSSQLQRLSIWIRWLQCPQFKNWVTQNRLNLVKTKIGGLSPSRYSTILKLLKKCKKTQNFKFLTTLSSRKMPKIIVEKRLDGFETRLWPFLNITSSWKTKSIYEWFTSLLLLNIAKSCFEATFSVPSIINKAKITIKTSN